MRIDAEDLRRHYRSISDEELLALDPEELTETAQSLCNEELARRGLTPGRAADSEDVALPDEVAEGEGDLEADTGPPPDWIGEAACAYSFTVYPKTPYADVAGQIRAVLGKAGIPCYLTLNEWEPPTSGAAPQTDCCVMVPGALDVHATSVLDRDMLNAEREEQWRKHFETLSDDELLALDPEVFCAGLLDRVARLKRAYRDEVERRELD